MASNRNEYQEYFLGGGGKGGRCIRLTTSPPSCAECPEIWEPQTPGNLWACNEFALPFTGHVNTCLYWQTGATLKSCSCHVTYVQQNDTCKCQDLWRKATSPSNEHFFKTAKRKLRWTFKLSEIRHCIAAWMIPTFRESHSAFFLHCLTFRKKALKSFGTLASTCVQTQQHIPETSVFQQHGSKNLKPHKTVCTKWFKYDRDWFVCKQDALRSSCATLREWSHNLHPPSCSG